MTTSFQHCSRVSFPARIGILAIILGVALRSSPAAAADIKVSCVGDSITAGYGASSSAAAYPPVLGTILGAGWQTENDGNSGKTMIKKPSDGASYWDQTEFARSQSFLPNIVVIMLGTNDSKSANWNAGNNTYAADYKSMVGIYLALASKPKVYAMLPPPALSSAFNISSDVIQNQIIPIIKTVAAETGINVIDLNTAFNANNPKSMMTSDGIHPNDAGYKFIAQTVAAALRASGNDGGAPDAAGADSAAKDAPASDARAQDDMAVGEKDVGSLGGGGAVGNGGSSGAGGAAGGSSGTGGHGGSSTSAGVGGVSGSGGSTIAPVGGSGGAPSGTAGASGATSAGGAKGTSSAAGTSSGSGCSCQIAGRNSNAAAPLLGLLAAVALRRRARGRRSRF